MTRLVTTLAAPAPGWTTEADVIVVGSGIAGLTAALELRTRVPRVLLVTKGELSSGSTVWAQGGIAAALAPTDTPAAHLADTLVAGAGVCDPAAVEVLVTEGPERVRELVGLGAHFDTERGGAMSLTREGGHHADRIAHAGGDATGAEISRALVAQLEAVRNDPGIEVIEHALVIDLLTSAGPVTPATPEGERRSVCGVTLHVRGTGTRDGVGAARGRAVVLATGGIGQIYVSSTNPPQATGDGIAAALRAGATLGDLEFVQFHPTVLWLGSGARGQLTLISEAVRGEGAYLIDSHGHRFMPAVHPMAELAPRDVVAHAIVRQMALTGSDHVMLDARHLGADFLRSRFPTITERLLDQGFDITEEPVPVAPAQHYHSGGVVTNLDGRTSLRGLYAVGEVACTGVHGANRLASNSLLEGLVFAHRAAADIAARMAAGELPLKESVPRPGPTGLVMAATRPRIQRTTTTGSGVLRSAESLGLAAEKLAAVRTDANLPEALAGDLAAQPQTAEWETSNVHQVASALTAAAALREESRGGHFRTDFPEPDPRWCRRVLVRLADDGSLLVERSAPTGVVPGLDAEWIADLVRRTLSEDLGGDPGRDVTSQATISAATTGTAHLMARQSGVVSGLVVVQEVVDQVVARLGTGPISVVLEATDGARVTAGDRLAVLSGPVQAILVAERSLLNLASRASGVATATRAWADRLAGTGAMVLDTRKTTPGLRALEKYAVRSGGGTNKRMGLYDVAMVKDNHVVAAGSVAAAIAAVRTAFPEVLVQVEADTMAQALEAIDCGARFLLLDNMPVEVLTATVAAVRAREPETGKVELEATGNLTLDRAAEVAATGVDYMSVGALTHSAPILDLALDLVAR